jgi:hypothetical protein
VFPKADLSEQSEQDEPPLIRELFGLIRLATR